MSNCILEFVNNLPKDIEAKITKGFVEYETSQGIDINYKKFALILKDHHGCVFPFLNAFTSFAAICIEDLWIDKFSRRKGYGRKLVQSLQETF